MGKELPCASVVVRLKLKNPNRNTMFFVWGLVLKLWKTLQGCQSGEDAKPPKASDSNTKLVNLGAKVWNIPWTQATLAHRADDHIGRLVSDKSPAYWGERAYASPSRLSTTTSTSIRREGCGRTFRMNSDTRADTGPCARQRPRISRAGPAYTSGPKRRTASLSGTGRWNVFSLQGIRMQTNSSERTVLKKLISIISAIEEYETFKRNWTEDRGKN